MNAAELMVKARRALANAQKLLEDMYGISFGKELSKGVNPSSLEITQAVMAPQDKDV